MSENKEKNITLLDLAFQDTSDYARGKDITFKEYISEEKLKKNYA